MKRSSSRKLTRIKKSSPYRVSKVTKQQQQQQHHQEQQQQKFYEIALKRPLSSSSSSSPSCPPLSPPSSISSPSSSVATPYDAIVSDDPQVHFLADQLKRQLSNALDKVSSSSSSSEHVGKSGDGNSKPSLRTSSLLSTTTPPDLVSDDVGAPAAASHRRLHNLDLLKQYLMFVAQEASIDIQHDDDDNNNDGCGERKIVIGIPNENHQIHPGARLIESYVHGQSKMTTVIEGLNKASSSHTAPAPKQQQQHRRRRRSSSSRQKQKSNAVQSSSAASAAATAAAEPTRMIKCICDTPNEGFGAMVQCDDCHRWLHLECLKMTNEFAHQENFACPQCFVSNDTLGRRSRVSSSITWRYAARRESERMAAAMDMEMTSDEEEEVQDQKSCSMSCCDDNDDDNDTDFGTSSSEASTPEYYVQAQEGASRMDYFAPHASDVFLCESSIHGPTTISPTTITTDALPSSLCTQDLLEFSFDTGPFWKPIL